MKKFTSIIFLLFFILSISFSQKLEIGDVLPNIELNKIQDDTLVKFNTSNISQNKVIIFEFWETYCAPCLESMKHLAEIYSKYKSDIEIICISQLPDNSAASFIKQHKYPFIFVFDKLKTLSKFFPHNGVPYCVILDRNKIVHNLGHPDLIIDNGINEIILGKSIDIKSILANYERNKDKNCIAKFSLEKSTEEIQFKSIKIERKKFSNGYHDSTELKYTFVFKSMTLLELYQLAYNFSSFQIEFNKNINFLHSKYDFLFSCISKDSMDAYKKLQKQLNFGFDLTTRIENKDLETFFVKEIKPQTYLTNSISFSSEKNGTIFYKANSDELKIKSPSLSTVGFIEILADCFKAPVFPSKELSNLNLKFDIDIFNKTKDSKNWINELKKIGVVVENKQTKINNLKVESNN